MPYQPQPSIKAGLRKKLTTQLDSISLQNREKASSMATQVFMGHELWNQTSALFSYWPMDHELSPLPLYQLGLMEQKQIGLVRIEDSVNRKLGFYWWNGNDDSLIQHPYGIKEPDPIQCPQITPAEIETIKGFVICLVPGLAFDTQGNRLGRGAGYYDRWISSVRQNMLDNKRRILFLGFCFDEQIIESVPTDSWDQPMDGLLTTSKLMMIAKKQSIQGL
jgi:5-formyltetrahydrofolate cyclo-ligase